MTDDFDPNDWPNDYSNPNAVASQFETLKDRIDQQENRLNELEKRCAKAEEKHDNSGGTGIWMLGASIAVVLSWSRNGSILYCIGHGIVSWIYVIYFAFTRS